MTSPRIPAMDVLRGCAVMGILWMNIKIGRAHV